jgi:hypothetical protein
MIPAFIVASEIAMEGSAEPTAPESFGQVPPEGLTWHAKLLSGRTSMLSCG